MRHTFENNHAFYLQDTYQLNPRLTFNVGIRWDYFGVVGEKDNLFTNVTNFDPVGQTVTLTQLGQPGLGSVYQPDYKNFSPRLSVAWDPLGKGRTIIRAGWGMFFDGPSQDVFLGELPYNCALDVYKRQRQARREGGRASDRERFSGAWDRRARISWR